MSDNHNDIEIDIGDDLGQSQKKAVKKLADLIANAVMKELERGEIMTEDFIPKTNIIDKVRQRLAVGPDHQVEFNDVPSVITDTEATKILRIYDSLVKKEERDAFTSKIALSVDDMRKTINQKA